MNALGKLAILLFILYRFKQVTKYSNTYIHLITTGCVHLLSWSQSKNSGPSSRRETSTGWTGSDFCGKKPSIFKGMSEWRVICFWKTVTLVHHWVFKLHHLPGTPTKCPLQTYLYIKGKADNRPACTGINICDCTRMPLSVAVANRTHSSFSETNLPN